MLKTSIIHTAKNNVISPNFLVWKLCLFTKFPHQEIGEITVFFTVSVSKILEECKNLLFKFYANLFYKNYNVVKIDICHEFLSIITEVSHTKCPFKIKNNIWSLNLHSCGFCYSNDHTEIKNTSFVWKYFISCVC